MRKIIPCLGAFILMLALTATLCPALAEDAPAAFDWTDVFVAALNLVAALGGGGMAYAWRKWVKPWLEQHQLTEAAKVVVWAVEALLGRYRGEEKWAAALERMKARGWDIDSQEVMDALKSAWKALDLTQLASGEKQPSSEEEA